MLSSDLLKVRVPVHGVLKNVLSVYCKQVCSLSIVLNTGTLSSKNTNTETNTAANTATNKAFPLVLCELSL